MFFVTHIFGGYYGDTSYEAYIPYLWFDSDNEEYVSTMGIDVINKTNFVDFYGNDISMSLGNYLSLIATIITMVIIVTLCALFIKKIINLIGGLIR